MKYYTLDRWISDQDPDRLDLKAREAASEYEAYYEGVRSKLPKQFVDLRAIVCLHDSRLREFRVDPQDRTVLLRLDSWDSSEQEPRFPTLVYQGVSVVQATSDPERGLPGPHGFGDLGYDEIEVLGDRLFEHRILFSSGIEIALTFTGFMYTLAEGISHPAA